MYRAHGRILFASAHCLTDFSSGAAIATLDALRLLARVNFQCGAFCASKLDGGSRDSAIGNRGVEVRSQRLMVSNQCFVELTHCTVGEVPIQIFETASSRIDHWAPDEPDGTSMFVARICSTFEGRAIAAQRGVGGVMPRPAHVEGCGATRAR